MPKRFTRRSSNNVSTVSLAAIYVLAGGFVLGAGLLGLFVSSVSIPIPSIASILAERTFGGGWLEDVPLNAELIIWNIRLPRVVLGLLVGAALALAGAAFQGLLRNPLAEPFTIGVSSGATLGAVLVLYYQISLFGFGVMATLPFVSIAGAFVALLIVFGMTRLSRRGMSIETIVLSGIIVSSFMNAIVSLLIALSDREDMGNILYWMMGNVAMRTWTHVEIFVPFFVAGAAMLLTQTRELNAMALGERTASNLGVNVKRRKALILIGAAMLTGASVAVTGSIGFVGLVIPHLVRLVVGSNHKYVLPLSMLIGGAFLACADVAARTIIAPEELPIGVITAMIGAPVFAWLLLKHQAGRRGSR